MNTTLLNVNEIRKDFPIFAQQSKPIIYLDNAATTQKPEAVIDAQANYYRTSNANVNRGAHTLGDRATEQYENARETVAQFINADHYEIIFTKGTTDSLNLIARMLMTYGEGDEIVVTEMEHHSNFVTWQQLAKEHNMKFKVIPVNERYELNMDEARKMITPNTRVVAVAHASNVLGVINPIHDLAKIAHDNGALIVVDGAQAVAHIPVDVKALDADFYAFSSHKMYGPMGIGVLYGKLEHLERMTPVTFGGGAIKQVNVKATTFADVPERFEPGTPDVAGAVGLAAAINYLNKIGMQNIQEYERELTAYALEKLHMKNIMVIGPTNAAHRDGIISIVVADEKGNIIHSHDVAGVMSSYGIHVRAGQHCAQPLGCAIGIDATTRISIGIYNTREEIDKLIEAIRKAQEVFNGA